MNSLRWQRTPAHTLCAYIAHSFLHQELALTPASKVLGSITLHRHQVDATSRIQRTISEFGGALLADTVGLGKTFVALAVARDYRHTHIVAPATLLPMWRDAITETASTDITLHSLQTLSRRPLIPCKHATRCLVIIDEAHHLRTRSTIRYHNAALFVANRDVLLLSATPIHNRPRDLQNLLALFLGHRTDALDNESLAQLIVRRTSAEDVETVAQGNDAAGRSSQHARHIPTVREHTPYRTSANPPVLEALLSLPAPLPTKDGAAASALIRLGLLRAWCSSDAALSHTLRRRQLRGEALLHSLSNGRYPTHRELQTWIVGNDSIQLGFPELLITNAPNDSAPLIATLSAHLHALHALLQLHTRLSHADPERAAILRGLLNTSPPALLSVGHNSATPIVAFSHFASTVHALHRALGDIAGVASLTAAGGRIASGAIPKQELIAQFAPSANSRPPPPEHQRIRLLLTTDILAEGVNLQDAGTLIHLDLPWTDAARAQRVGRLARLGSHHAFVDVHTFAPPPGIDRTLKIVATLARKARLSATTIGHAEGATAHARDAAIANVDVPVVVESAPELATRLRTALMRWALQSGFAPALIAPSSREALVAAHPTRSPAAAAHVLARDDHKASSPMSVAYVVARQTGFIAVVTHDNVVRVVSNLNEQIDHSSALLMRAIDAINSADCANTVACRDGRTPGTGVLGASSLCAPRTDDNSELNAQVMSANQRLAKWHQRETLAALAGPRTRALSVAHKLALKTIAHALALASAPARAALITPAEVAERLVLRSSGAGVEIALQRWCALFRTLPSVEWLRSIQSMSEFARASDAGTKSRTSDNHSSDQTVGTEALRVHAILLLTTAKLRE